MQATVGTGTKLAAKMPGVNVMVRVRPMLPRELSYDAAVETISPVSADVSCTHCINFKANAF